MNALLGNHKGIVKPWYLPYDFILCRVGNFKSKAIVVHNNIVANVYNMPVIVHNGQVVGRRRK